MNECFKLARKERYELMTVENLLLSLINEPTANEALEACGANIKNLERDLKKFISKNVPLLSEEENNDKDTVPTLGFQRVLQRAVYHAQSTDKKDVTGADVLVAIFGERESHAVYYLSQQNIARLDVLNFVHHVFKPLEEEFEFDENLDYRDLLKKTVYKLDKITEELQVEKENKEKITTKYNIIEEEIYLARKTIQKLKSKLTESEELFSFSQRVKPEHQQAVLSIMNYFAEILEQKYPEERITVRAEKENDCIRLKILSAGNIGEDIIKSTFNDYMLVVIGDYQPNDLLENPVHIAQLKNKLDLAKTEIRSNERLMMIQGDTITNLNETIRNLLLITIRSQDTLFETLKTPEGNSELNKALAIISELVHKNDINQEETILLEETLMGIEKIDNSKLKEIKTFCINMSSSTAAGIVLNILKSIGFL